MIAAMTKAKTKAEPTQVTRSARKGVVTAATFDDVLAKIGEVASEMRAVKALFLKSGLDEVDFDGIGMTDRGLGDLKAFVAKARYILSRD